MKDRYLLTYGQRAKDAARIIASASAAQKNQALIEAATQLREQTTAILEANKKDCERAKANGMASSMLDRLALTPARIEGMAEGIEQLVQLTDPIGEVVAGWRRPNGLEITKKRVPLGVLGIIFEARPNVTADAAGLCIKSGNACILRGGSEALHSNLAIAEVFAKALEQVGLPAHTVQLLDNPSREYATGLMQLNRYVDVLIPRGGAGLIRNVVEHATVPVIQTGTGNCHVYVDESAAWDQAVEIVLNAKVQRPSVCNAAETLLVHQAIAEEFLPLVSAALEDKKVELRGCPRACHYWPSMKPAQTEDWATEYNDLILAVKVVDSLEEAIEHINQYGTMHSEAILTQSYAAAQKFQQEVDAACVYVNASTRYTDGFEFGFGAEIGISNQKLHARGPMGLQELTTTKYCINGSGQIR